MIKIRFLLFLSLLCLPTLLLAESTSLTFESEGMKVKLEKVAEGFGVPWGLTFLSSNELLVTERGGSVQLVYLDQSRKVNLKNVPEVLVKSQGGMLDVVVSPDYKTTGWIYFTYVKAIKGGGATVLARARLKGDKFSNWQELLITRSASNTSRHFGSRITFDEKGHVFFGVGDRGERPNAQNLTNHAGTIIRLNLDGTVPEDNPFNNPWSTGKTAIKNKSPLAEIWSYGHRNPQGMAYDFLNRRLWSIEHGPRGGDEINLILPGLNYGWPVISYGKEYWGPVSVGEGTHRKGMVQPVKVYIPSIAPGSLIIYSASAFPKWTGNLFSGALKLQHINRIAINREGVVINEERLLEDMKERIRALAQSPEGWIYFSTDSGKIYRLKPVK